MCNGTAGIEGMAGPVIVDTHCLCSILAIERSIPFVTYGPDGSCGAYSIT